MTTRADAAIRYLDHAGRIEIALIEWKYTEDYRGKELSPERRLSRRDRYRPLWLADDGPVQTEVVPCDDLFVEPFYQLLRQQLLAREMEKAHEGGAQRVRIVHVSPPGNEALRASLNRDSQRAVGADVFGVWRAVVRRSSNFVTLDSSLLCNPRITSAAYRSRYDHP